MLRQALSPEKRENVQVKLNSDLVVVGGGMAGTCAAITAARKGIKVILVQDRPVLGGNGSSEVRLWILGATSHMGNNNRWAREGGVIDEILVENLYRNKEGNAVIFDTILLEKVMLEKNITLLLNTTVIDVEKSSGTRIKLLKAYCSQNATEYILTAPLFCDTSGDGVVGFKSGASFRMGAESGNEFGEGFTPTEEYGELLGHTIYFYSKNTGKPVKYVAPSFALTDINKIPRFRNIKTGDMGCNFWWFEYGGRLNTIYDTEKIKWELWSVVYGVWNYIKNSGKFPESDNLTLEWVGVIPGKRESRRFEGLYMLKQQDIVEQTEFYDAVSFGGWAIDLHPADGVFSELPGCNQYHSKGVYQIPYRCFVSKDIENLFVGGRLMSASHVAFGSTRVMATAAHGGQAIGMAAAICAQSNYTPAELSMAGKIKLLQQELNIAGQSIPAIPIDNTRNLASSAIIEVSSELVLNEIPFNGDWFTLDISAGQLLPLKKNVEYSFEVMCEAKEVTMLEIELSTSSREYNYTPDVVVEKQYLTINKGVSYERIRFKNTLKKDQYGFIIFRRNSNVKIRCSQMLVTGIVSVFNKINLAVNNHGKQTPPENSGFESFEFWCPERRPKGQNLAMNISPGIDLFGKENLINGYTRPFVKPNAWVAAPGDKAPAVTFYWDKAQEINEIILYLDTDYDHPMESSQMGHPEDVIPFCLRNYKITDGEGNLIYGVVGNHQTIQRIILDKPVNTDKLSIMAEPPFSGALPSIFEIGIY